MTSVTFTTSGTWNAPSGIIGGTIDCECWAEGGDGGTGIIGGSSHSGGGGGGGEFARESSLAVTSGSNYSYTIGTGGSGTNTSFPGNSVTVTAHFGATAVGASHGTGGSGSTNSSHQTGGSGGNGVTATNPAGGGGGGGAGSSGGGGTGGTGLSGGTGGTGGTAGTPDGGAGGKGGAGNVTGNAGQGGSVPGGGGGGGSGRTGGTSGGNGAAGQITLTYTATQTGTTTLTGTGTLSAFGAIAGITSLAGVGTLSALRSGSGNTTLSGVGTLSASATQRAGAALSGVGTMSATGGLPAPAVVNQWANNYGQGTAFGSVSSSLQSCVVPLTPAFSVGSGSGISTEGNWLFCIASWTQAPAIASTHVGVSDDIHSWWRQAPASNPSGNVRTSISYTPNIAREVDYVYCAPDAAVAAINVLVVEVAGLGPWDTLAGVNSNYTSSGTSVALSLGTPGQPSFFIGGVGGSNVSSGQAFLPSGYSALVTQTQSNGVDTTADNILTSAYRSSSALSQSVSGTSSSSESLAGYLLGVYVSGQNPIPASQNPNWPYTKFEIALGGGFNTPDSELTWFDLTNRLWSWDETSGIQYQLGQLQSTNLNIEIDNFDGALSQPVLPASPYYSNALNSNMSFQSGTSPWTTQNNATVVRSSAFAFASASGSTATYSMQVNGNGATANPTVLSEKVPVIGSFQYSGSVRVYSASSWSSGINIGFNWYDSGGSFISSTGFVITSPLPAGTWTLCPTTGVSAPSNAATGQLAIIIVGTPGAGQAFYLAEAAVVAGGSVVFTGGLLDGTPMRLRMALGTMGGQQVNRWYVLQRNSHEWEEEINASYRKWCPVSGTDLWSAMSSVPPTFYRSEIYGDNPGWWWPMDDQPLENGVLPVTLLNAAIGNTKVMTIASDPGGVIAQDSYGFNGVDITQTIIGSGHFTQPQASPPAGGVATYAVGTNSGWMYGDPPSATSSISATGNPVESSPGSASWQQAGLLGTGGSNGWYLICNDATFPGLSGGITLKGWFNVGLFGNGSGYAYTNNLNPEFDWVDTSICGQPFSPITICELATSSNPVAVLQLDSSGHLNLITYNGGTGTSHSVYSASDLRNGTWTSVDITLTTTTWNVLLNGGMTANVSGSATGMTSAWTYLILCGDFGSSGGASPASLVHGGNMSLSHWAIFPYILPAWRILSHYTAAITGFGLVPAPAAAQITPVSSPPFNVSTQTSGSSVADDAAYQTTPDGQFYDGNYGKSGGPDVYSYSLITTANAGSYSSGPSARTVTSGIGQVIPDGGTPVTYNTFGAALWLSWIGVAPGFNIYSSAAANAEKLLENVVADGVAVTSGYGSGASPPTAATPLGDTVGQRIERLMQAGRVASPQRSIDPAPDLVQAPGFSGGGQQTGTNIQAIQQSDSGLLFTDNVGNLVYWMRDHLASQYSNPVWTLSPNAPPMPGASATAIPYDREYQLINDPQRIFNVITVQPFSPSGAQLPLLTPQDADGVLGSQDIHGAQPYAVTSYLQDQTLMQQQADWLFANFGEPQTRAEYVRVDAAPYPAAWSLIAGVNVGDIVTLEEWQVGGGGQVLTLRVTEINRKIRFGGQNEGNHGEGDVVASVELICDFEPTSYWGD